MATKRRSIHVPTSGLNFRPSLNDIKYENKGTKPTPQPHSVKEIFALMVLYICKKSLFFDTNLKVAIYLGGLFLISLIADFGTVPRIYLSRSDNIFNQYFVKFAWGWNLLLLFPYIVLTAYVYCCGQIKKIIHHHLLRLFVATFFWWFWTSFFNYVEAGYGKCNLKGFNSKTDCLKAGNIWNGFDISGHSFILIYGSLIMIEEARSLINWDSIKEHIRLEDHYRLIKDTSQSTNPLKNLTDIQFRNLKLNYEKFTPYIRGLFVAVTFCQILWDVMLICTMLYHHIMIEKFLGGTAAILTWFFTYKFWFSTPALPPKLPGEGVFRYIKPKGAVTVMASSHLHMRKRSGSLINNGSGPMFMGRKLYAAAPGDAQEEAR